MASNSKNNDRENTVDNVVINGILTIMERNSEDTWVGTMTDLNSTLNRILGRKKSEVLPGSPSALRVVINRVTNRLRNRSVGVKFGRTTDHSRTRFVRFTR